MEPLRSDDPRSLGGFRLLALLAVGGMGRVYLAVDAGSGPAVALKVARAEFAGDPRFRARFRREVETGRGMGRRSDDGEAWIAPIVAADPEAELPWLASEYVPGPSVTEALMGFGPLSAPGLRTLTRGLASALTEVHAAGVVHRDVKPSNVLLARDGPRLIDFGVARAIDDAQLTRVGALIGSPGFLSPEQAVGKTAGFGSDVFSMASVVAYAACGVGPFGDGAGPALLYRVVHEAPTLVNVPRDLREVLAACLVKDPGERPSASEVASLVTAEDEWLPESVLADIARREAELAAWLEVAGADARWTRAVAAVRAAEFEAAADTALEVANAGEPDPAAQSAAGIPAARDTPGLPAPAPTSPRPRTTHRRTVRRPRVPVYAAVGALVGAAATTAVLLLPHGGHGAPQPSQGPGPVSTSTTSPPSEDTAGKNSGSARQHATTAASSSPR